MKHIPRTTLLFTLISALPMSFAAASEKQAELTEKHLLQSFDSLADTLKQARQQVTQAVTERDHALKDLASTRKAAADKDRQIAELKKQLAESQQHGDAWKQKAVAYEKSAAEWKQTAEERAAKLAIGGEVQKRLGGFRERLDKTMHEFGTLEAELAKLRDELKEPRQMASLVKENQQLKAEIGKTRDELKNVATTRETTKKDLEKATAELAAAKKSLAELDQRSAKAKQSAEAAEAARSKLEAELRKSQAEAARARQQLEQVGKTHQDEKSAIVKEHRTALGTLAETSRKLEAAHQQAEQQKKQLSKVEGELAATATARKKLAGEIQSKEQVIEELRGKLKSRNEETAGTKP